MIVGNLRSRWRFAKINFCDAALEQQRYKVFWYETQSMTHPFHLQLRPAPDFTIMHKVGIIPRAASNNDGSDASGGRVLMQDEVVDNLFTTCQR